MIFLNIYEVKFSDNGKSYFYNGSDLRIPNRVTVIVETDKGLQFGRVIRKMDFSKLNITIESLKNIIRISTKKDYEQYLNNLKDAELALKDAKRISSELQLAMHFLDASFNFERKQLLFNFYADERVDFRELAKRLANIYKTRIELRQIGARDKAEQVGGIGVCGRKLCCSSYLRKLESVSMSMAKNQNLALNPSKINGVCGRLLCCLAYEDSEYLRCSNGIPSVGSIVKTEFGEGAVVSIDILNRRYKVSVNNEIKEIMLKDENGD